MDTTGGNGLLASYGTLLSPTSSGGRGSGGYVQPLDLTKEDVSTTSVYQCQGGVVMSTTSVFTTPHSKDVMPSDASCGGGVGGMSAGGHNIQLSPSLPTPAGVVSSPQTPATPSGVMPHPPVSGGGEMPPTPSHSPDNIYNNR